MPSQILRYFRLAILFAAIAAISLSGSIRAAAQVASPVANRLTRPIDEQQLVSLGHMTHPLATAGNDRGAAPDDMRLDRIQITLKRTQQQEASLQQLIHDMHNPSSGHYHHWLTPEEFGKQFGPSDDDIATLSTWLQSHGFTVKGLVPGRQVLEVSGSVAQLRGAFHTQIHTYSVGGVTRFANPSDPQLPEALSPVVGGFASLNNFPLKRYSKVIGKATYNTKTHASTPSWTTGNSAGVSFVLSPADYAVQYDLNPLYQAGTDGTGQAIAIVNESNINVARVNAFRELFGLPYNPPQVIIDGNDPGLDGINNPDGPNGASVEAYLDVEWAGAVAPGATIDLVIAADTALSPGIYLAAEHAVYSNIAPVISVSFGYCEANLGSTNAFLSNLWEQAAAQGITVAVSTGDSGSAACDDDNTEEFALYGTAVSGWASTPYNVAVGGSDFYYSAYNQGHDALSAQLHNYWNYTPSDSQATVSIQGVIPEQPWNAGQYGLNIEDYFANNGATTIAGGSGGASSLGLSTVVNGVEKFGPYPKPAWQSGAGVPADGVRDIPDVALFASSGSNVSYYPICWDDGDCQPVSNGDEIQVYGVGGTSASAPSFAGILALVNQKYGRQGQADFLLYPLAKQFPAAFHDVTVGTNAMACNLQSVDVMTALGPETLPPTDCIPASNPVTTNDPNFGSVLEGEIGASGTADYNAAPGYDLATGLGTVDASVLVNNWGSVTFAASTTTLVPSSTSFAHGTEIMISGSVAASSNGSAPTGNVALMTDNPEPSEQGQTVFQLANGSYQGSANSLPGGTYNIWGVYSGDGVNAPSSSDKITITVSPEDSATALQVFTPTSNGVRPIPSGGAFSYGTTLALSAVPTGSSGNVTTPPTGTIAFADNSNPLSTVPVNAQGEGSYTTRYGIGSHSITASYSGDKSYNASASPAATFTITPNSPSMEIWYNQDATVGSLPSSQPVYLTVWVQNSVASTGMASAPTGSVSIAGAPAGTPASAVLSAAIDPNTNAPHGVATIQVPQGSQPGTYSVTFSYPGDANYTAASETINLVITGPASGLASTTTVTTSSPNTSQTAGVSVSTTVTGQPGHAAPTGTLTFYSSGYELGSLVLPTSTGSSVSRNIVLTNEYLFQGSNQMVVQYSGDNTYLPSIGTATITNPRSDFSLSPSSAVVELPASGTAVDVITISSHNGFTGPISATCNASSGVSCALSAPSVTLTANGSANLMLSLTPTASAGTGPYSSLLVATDATGAFVHTLNIQVLTTPVPAPSLALTATPVSNLVAGETANATVSIAPIGGFNGSVALSCAVTATPTNATEVPVCTVAPAPGITGSAAVTSTLTIISEAESTLGNYTYTVTASTGSVAQTVVVPVTVVAPPTPPAAPGFALSSAPLSPIDPGQSGSDAITVTPSGGFTGSVALSCAVTASPQGAVETPTCMISAPAAINGDSPVTATLTIKTQAATTTAAQNSLRRITKWSEGVALAAMLFLGIPARRKAWRATLGFCFLLAISAATIGCGGRASAPPSSPVTTPGTTAGSYTITVTGTGGSITESVNVTAVVN